MQPRTPSNLTARTFAARSVAALLATTAFLSPSLAQAQTWTGAVNNDYNNPGNWSTGTVPPTSGTVVTVNGTPNAPVVDGGTASASSGLIIGDGGATAGQLTVRNGGRLIGIGQTSIGGSNSGVAGGDGTVIVTGTGSLLQGTDQIFVGQSLNSRGTLTIENGGTVRGNAGSFGVGEGSVATVTVRGASSLLDLTGGLLNLGSNNVNAGRATLNILDGGRVVGSTGTTNFVNSVSAISISGANSQLSSRAGLTMNGVLLIEDGGTLNYAQGISIGGATTIRNGTISTAGSSGLGIVAGGTLVADGSTVTAGAQFNVAGTATLRGTALSTPLIGISQNGVLNIGGADGAAPGAPGTISAESIMVGEPNSRLVFNHTGPDLVVNAAIRGNGRVLHLAGTTVLTTAPYSGGVTGIDVTGGSLFVDGRVTARTLTLGNGAMLGGTGTLNGSVAVTNGIITPGNRGVGTLTVGNLSLTAASILNLELGAPGTPGVGSDLIKIGNIDNIGNLTLDGTLNVANVGGFGAGLYRLINYGGTLTNNGLLVGLVPMGFNASDLTIQTSVAREVNLIVAAPVPVFNSFTFWDGANTAANNMVDGGTGTWTATGRNWTVSTGQANGVYDPSQFLIFAGASGVVTINNSAGAVVQSAGMQFAADGYRVTGDALGFGTTGGLIRVGDGTMAGANFVATIDSVLTGSSLLRKTDLGTLVLTGANTYSGGSQVDNGTLQGNATSLQGAIAVNAGGTVRFAQAAAGTYAGVLSGTGRLIKDQAGTLTLTGTSRGFAGQTQLAAGGIALTGSLGGLLTTAAGTQLTGNGTVGSLDLGGTLTPGAGTATFTVTGDLNILAGSTFAVDVAAAGGNDRIAVGGRATIGGGTVAVTALDPDVNYTNGTVYRIVNAVGGLTGTFAGLTESSAFLDFRLGYDPTGAFLTTSIIAQFPDVALTYNQRQAATGLMNLGRAAGSDSNAVFNAIAILGAGPARAAFDASSGEIYPTLLANGQRAGLALGNRMTIHGRADAVDGFALWGGVVGGKRRVDSDGNGARVEADGFGGELGLDYRGGDNQWAAGFGIGWRSGSVSLNARNSRAETDTKNIGAYARYGTQMAGLTATANFVYANDSADITRQIAFGSISRTARSSTDVDTTAASAELRYGTGSDSLAFGPLASIEVARSKLDGLTETGASALNLSTRGASEKTRRYGVGGFARYVGTNGYFDLGVRYVRSDAENSGVNLTLAGSPTPFNIRTARGSQSAMRIDAETQIALSERLTLSGYLGAISAADEASIDGHVRLSFRF